MDAAHLDGSRSYLNWIYDEVGGVLDPLAEHYRGRPVDTVRPVLARTWRREFGAPLGEPGLSDAATAISEGTPWDRALWTGGW